MINGEAGATEEVIKMKNNEPEEVFQFYKKDKTIRSLKIGHDEYGIYNLRYGLGCNGAEDLEISP